MRPSAYIKTLAGCGAAVLLTAALAYAASTETTTKPAPKSTTHKASHPVTKSSHSAHKGKGKRSRKAVVARKRGQQKIDSARAQQIQEALIREHYLNGTPSRVWDASTQEAMQKYQADHGWQSKTTPDSRALIKLGLGPDQQHLLNPESAMTSGPASTAGVADPPKTPVSGDSARPQN